MRLFFAVKTSSAVAEAISEAIRKLGSGAHGEAQGLRRVPIGNLHLTLRFLGETEERLLPELERIGTECVEGLRPFHVAYHGFGAFPKASRARVLWVGVRDREQRLREIAARLEGPLRNLGLEPEEREYAPHLTIARLKAPRALQSLIEAHRDAAFGIDPVDRVVLYQSVTWPSGSEYRVLREFSLTPPSGAGLP